MAFLNIKIIKSEKADELPELSPCPKCGSTDVRLDKFCDNRVICSKCGIRNGYFNTVKKAIDDWNKRKEKA